MIWSLPIPIALKKIFTSSDHTYTPSLERLLLVAVNGNGSDRDMYFHMGHHLITPQLPLGTWHSLAPIFAPMAPVVIDAYDASRRVVSSLLCRVTQL